ncbi:hypothetical protein SDC9_190673 [bioreactor metagenome]|uniref:Uncharacterized protein n=1 Tax=bioreactor metagenome TaxID=1076179 RepID=A0A645I3X3_9ZZZZ
MQCFCIGDRGVLAGAVRFLPRAVQHVQQFFATLCLLWGQHKPHVHGTNKIHVANVPGLVEPRADLIRNFRGTGIATVWQNQ